MAALGTEQTTLGGTTVLPTLGGRIQTRLVLLAVVGGVVTLIIGPLLPISAPLSVVYRNTFIILATVAVLGIAWECVYHFVMQWRWEKDWPTLFGLATGIPEGVLVWLLLRAGLIPGISGTVPTAAFVIDFGLIWLAVWFVANGPMRVPFIRWRFHGGRLV
jgi:hypothetical protein